MLPLTTLLAVAIVSHDNLKATATVAESFQRFQQLVPVELFLNILTEEFLFGQAKVSVRSQAFSEVERHFRSMLVSEACREMLVRVVCDVAMTDPVRASTTGAKRG